jgi:hypothetical protein
MSESRLHSSAADEAPSENTFTGYDERHLLVYADLVEIEADGDWDEAALLVLCIDPVREPLRARRVWEGHLTRAKWLVDHGYGHPFRLERPTEFRMWRPKGAERSAYSRSYWTSDCRISSTGHSLFALITRTCDPSDPLMRACEHVLSSIFLTSISAVGSHCKVSAMSAGHMRHAELSLNSTM